MSHSPTHTVIRPAKNGKTKIIRSAARWSDAAEERFLAKLAETCNITAAAEAAGFSTTTLYKRKRQWPGFAAEWQAAIDQGYTRLEAYMVELATDSLRQLAEGARARDKAAEGQASEGSATEGQAADTAAVGPAGSPAMTVGEITNILRLHRAAQRGGAPQNYGWRRGAPDPEAIRASILRKLEAIERADSQRPRGGGDLVPQADRAPIETPACAGEQGCTAPPPERT